MMGSAITLGSKPKGPLVLGGAGGGASFTPTSISGLQIWLKADALLLNDADPLTTWTDASGLGRSPTQATGSSKPTFKTAIKNGLAVVRFDGTDDFLRSSAFTAVPQPTTHYLVVYWSTGVGSANPFVIDGLPAGNRQAFTFRTAAGGNKASPFAGSAFANGTSERNLVWSLVTILFNGASSVLRVNGVVENNTTNPGTNDVAGLTLGGDNAATPSAWFGGDIGEYYFYSGLHDASQITANEGYLNTKWAVY